MKYYISCIIVVLIAATCPALTIFQTWDVNDWTTYIGTGANASTVINPAAGGLGSHYLATDLYGNNVNDGVSAIYTALGDANIPAGTLAGAVPEFWMQYDFKNTGGDGSYSAVLGIFNSDADNDRIPELNWISLQNNSAGRTVLQARHEAVWVNSAYVAGDGSQAYRVKAHIYNSGTQTLMDVNVYGFDAITFEFHLIGSISPVIILDTGQSFDLGMDVFGVRNSMRTPGSTVHTVIRYDNMYFSTDGPRTEDTPPPFGMGRYNPNPNPFGMAYKMIAQPESKEVFFYGETIPTSSTDDPNISRLTYTSYDLGLYDGDLVLAFRLPELPSGKVISKATLTWYYWRYLQGYPPQIDLYAITPYRDGSVDPGISGCYAEEDCADYYVGVAPDITDAVLIQENIAPVSVLDPYGIGYIEQWVSSDVNNYTLAAFLQSQYLAGADVNDWILLRFSPAVISTHTVQHDIIGPGYLDPNYRPSIEYELVDANEGYWQTITLETPTTITNTGVLTTPPPPGSLGCFDTGGGVLKNAEFIVPFQFPELQSGKYIKGVVLTGNWGGRSSAGVFDTDIYGLPHRSSTSFQSSDFWTGPYAPQVGDVPDMNCGTPLESDVFDGFPSYSGQTWSIDTEGSLRTACYMNALKAAGATSSDYGFFRFGMRYDDFNYYVQQTISDLIMWARVVTEAPTCPAAPDTEGACPAYNNPNRLTDEDGDCRVTFADLSIFAANWLDCDISPSIFCP